MEVHYRKAPRSRDGKPAFLFDSLIITDILATKGIIIVTIINND